MVSVEVRTDDLANESLNLLEKNESKVLIVHQTETVNATTEDEDEEER